MILMGMLDYVALNTIVLRRSMSVFRVRDDVRDMTTDTLRPCFLIWSGDSHDSHTEVSLNNAQGLLGATVGKLIRSLYLSDTAGQCQRC